MMINGFRVSLARPVHLFSGFFNRAQLMLLRPRPDLNFRMPLRRGKRKQRGRVILNGPYRSAALPPSAWLHRLATLGGQPAPANKEVGR
jgi:hypothetical protein